MFHTDDNRAGFHRIASAVIENGGSALNCDHARDSNGSDSLQFHACPRSMVVKHEGTLSLEPRNIHHMSRSLNS